MHLVERISPCSAKHLAQARSPSASPHRPRRRTRPTWVTVVTSDQPQVQLMSMVLTMQAVEQGQSVHMLLCGAAGGDLALTECARKRHRASAAGE